MKSIGSLGETGSLILLHNDVMIRPRTRVLIISNCAIECRKTAKPQVETESETEDLDLDDSIPTLEERESLDDSERATEIRRGMDLATTLERIEKNFVITDPCLPDNPIVSLIYFCFGDLESISVNDCARLITTFSKVYVAILSAPL